MPELTLAEADIHLDEIDDALTAAGIRPDHFDHSDCDEYAEDGITTVPSAVLTRDRSDPLMVGPAHGRFEHGVLVAWDALRGRVIAELNADHADGPSEPLSMPVLAPPARVAATIARAVLGSRSLWTANRTGLFGHGIRPVRNRRHAVGTVAAAGQGPGGCSS